MTREIRLGAMLAILSQAGWAGDFVHPKLKSREAEIGSVLMLPPIAEMTQRGVKGTQALGKEAEEAIDLLASSVSAALINKGLQVGNPFTPEALQDNDEIKYAVADVQKRFDQIAAQLYKKHKDVRKGRFSLGDSVAVLNPDGAADALIIIRADGIKMTKGKSLMTGGLIGVARAGTAEVKSRVALVDARNGDVLFLGDYESRGLPSDKTYEKSFRHIPVAPGARLRPPVPEAARAEPEPAAPLPPPPTEPAPAAGPGPFTIAAGQTIEDVERGLGQPHTIVELGSKKIYLYKGLKITFVDGKVSDVE
jgi:hypothetical protein